jgi:hypothetical protein
VRAGAVFGGLFYKKEKYVTIYRKIRRQKWLIPGSSEKSLSPEITGRLHHRIEGKCKDRETAKWLIP